MLILKHITKKRGEMKKLIYLGVLLISIALVEISIAGEKIEPSESIATMDEVIVTSITHTETTMDKIGGNAISIVTAREIKEKNCHTLAEVIKSVPGVVLSSNGGMGTTSGVFMRGADSKNTLVLIDGVMVNDPSQANRNANISDINLDNVERIEVVRGAMSVMYGSNATAGVINIITKKGKKKPEINFIGEGGSYGTWKTGGSASGATDKMNFSISASNIYSDGFSVADNDNDKIDQDNNDEKDRYKNLTLAGKLGFDINENFKIISSVRYVASEVELDDYSSGYAQDNSSNPDGLTDKRSESERIWGQVKINNTFAENFMESGLSYKFSRNDRQSYDNSNAPWYDYKGVTDDISWQGNLNFETNTLSLGGGYFLETMESDSSSVSESDSNTISGWIQDQFFFGENFVFIAGARLDKHDKFGSKTTFRIAPSYEIQKTSTLLKTSFGTGFRSPSLYELYSSYGNLNLQPETSSGWDAGFEQKLLNGAIKFGATYFAMNFNDKIDYDWSISKYNQINGTTKTRGVETFASLTLSKNFSFGANYTYTDTKEPDGGRLTRRPYHQVNLNTRYSFLDKGIINIDAMWVDDRIASPYAKDSDGNSIEKLDAYVVVNLSASYDICNSFQIFTRVENLFDEYYEEAFSYATAGLSGYIGFKITW
jgi:vitamin B12 transporter